jgi:1,6-anhydro-N-acetylmuramate kinase
MLWLSPTEGRAPGSSPKPNSGSPRHTPESVERKMSARGQTVRHGPASGLTAQIDDGPGLARRFGTRLRFRAADMAAGRQGAPLVPVYHHAALDWRRAVAVLNIGVANVTYVDQNDDLAHAFAYLAGCTLQAAPITFPGTTGV